jgi:anti-sigma B factor antagonist
MEISTKQFKRCDLVSVTGRIDSQTALELKEILDAILNAGRFRIVLDMGCTEYISSAGLRILIDTQKTCRRWNRGEVILARVPERVHEVFDLVGFVPLFEFYDDVTHAVSSF